MSHKLFRSFFVLIFIIGLVTIQAPQPARAAGPWYVATTGDDNNDCLSPSTPCATINGAIGKASSGDTVHIAIGIYTNPTTNGAGVVWIPKDIMLIGGWNETFTIQTGMSTIDGQSVRGGIEIGEGNVTLDRLVIQYGNNGGIHIDSFGPSQSMLTLNNSTVNNNSNDYGGGIEINYGTVILNNSSVNNNIASTSGGGIYIYGGIVTLNNSTISENTAQSQGGGIYYNYLNTRLDINNSSIVNNSSSQGGGFYRYMNSGTVSFRNSILANNTAATDPDCAGTIDSSDYNIIGNTSGCTISASAGNLTNVDPLVGTLQDNGGLTFTHALLPSSPAIDAGNPAGCTDQDGNLLTTDQRGVARPQGAVCDIGAFELEIVSPVKEVTIDIKPGSQSNPINRKSLGKIPVAILSAPDFDAPSEVDKTSLTFGSTGDETSLAFCNMSAEDVNNDGLLDQVCHFNTWQTGFQDGNIQGFLKGQTVDGTSIEGRDSVRIVH